MNIAFRTDASLDIGTGHVMRCLTLADALRARGAECAFICREHPGNLIGLIRERGYEVHGLPMQADHILPAEPDGGLPAHAAWLSADWATDAEQTRLALQGQTLDWLVVDHYALDQRWEQNMRSYCHQLMVIDDLADRPHDCDLLLDQNLGRTEQDYGELLNRHTRILVGPRYALLRPEFMQWRSCSLARRTNGEFKKLLITMGGVDKDNATGQMLDALKVCNLPPDLQITVVMGHSAPWLAQVQEQALQMHRPTQVLVGVINMAELMAKSDLAIGAAGSTSWERCCLGLPSLMLVLAENQLEGANALHESGAAIVLKNSEQITDAFSRMQLVRPSHPLMVKMSAAAAALTDGSGCGLAANELMESTYA